SGAHFIASFRSSESLPLKWDPDLEVSCMLLPNGGALLRLSLTAKSTTSGLLARVSIVDPNDLIVANVTANLPSTEVVLTARPQGATFRTITLDIHCG